MASPGDSFTVAIPFNVNRIGDVPVSIDIEYGDFKIRRSFELVSRIIFISGNGAEIISVGEKILAGSEYYQYPSFRN